MAIWNVPVVIRVEAESAEEAQESVLACEIGSPVTGNYDLEMTVAPLDAITREDAE